MSIFSLLARRSGRAFVAAAFVSSLGLGAACSAGTGDSSAGGSGGTASSGTLSGTTGTGFGTGTTGTTTPGDGCAAAAKLIYVLSVQNQLYSFDPNIAGTAAYKLVGTLQCASSGNPQSMSVDRNGTAYVFYDSGQMFQVSTQNAACTPTAYVHPVQNVFNQLGMGFTATQPNVTDETLYIISPDFGLSTVSLPSFGVKQLGGLVTAAELTGGFDGKLFMFEASSATIAEIDRTSLQKTPIHSFQNLSGTQAWAFSRYAGKFYVFTSPDGTTGSTTTQYDPVMKVQAQRDADVGFTIVGAGQSTCVPPPPPL